MYKKHSTIKWNGYSTNIHESASVNLGGFRMFLVLQMTRY